MSDIKDKPNKYPLPPILTIGMLVACYFLDRFLPNWVGSGSGIKFHALVPEVFILVVAIALDIWSFLTFSQIPGKYYAP